MPHEMRIRELTAEEMESMGYNLGAPPPDPWATPDPRNRHERRAARARQKRVKRGGKRDLVLLVSSKTR